jgi:hypothetical protein
LGALDQFIKEVFKEETSLATKDGVRFEVPPETKTTELHADGMLYLLSAEKVANLPLPWSLMKAPQLVLEFKMQGDKLDRYQYERALLRRQAAQVEYLKKYPDDKNPIHLPLWIVTGYAKSWFSEKGFLLSQVAPACYRLEPSFYEIYLLASNELEPLREDLIPFLVTRTGQKLVEFCKWLIDVRPERCEELLELAPMSDAQHEDILNQLKEPEMAERLRRKRRFAETMAEVTGLQEEWRQEGQQEGQKKTLVHLLEKRFTRVLTQEENSQLTEKILRLGADRISDVVLELGKDALASWLSDPQAM